MNPYLNPLLPLYTETLNLRSLRIVTYATEEPISLATAQQHLRLDLYEDNGSPASHPDDELIQTVYIPAAREYCESLSGRAFALQEYEYASSSFPNCYSSANPYYGIRLPLGPVRQITSITYLTDAGEQTLDPESYYAPFGEDMIYPNPMTGGWPSGLVQAPNAAKIRFTAGYGLLTGSPTDDLQMPARYKNAILLMLHHFYENRSGTEIPSQVPTAIEFGVKALLLPSMLRTGFGT
jgi:uncharacterized phiE125 gp8 family phage protein